jgi:hypothetical protein
MKATLLWIAVYILVLLFAHGLAHAEPMTWTFTGSSIGSMDYASYNGSLVVDLDQPLGTVRNLAGTTGYSVLSWSMTATSRWDLLPSTTFSSDSLGHTAEYCLGRCYFGATSDVNVVRFLNGNLSMQLTFTPDLWKEMSWYRIDKTPMLMVTSGTAHVWEPIQASTVSVPGPNTLILMGLGMLGFYALTRKGGNHVHV